MKVEIELRLIVEEKIYKIIERNIKIMNEERHASIIKALLDLFDYNSIDTIHWKFGEEIYIK